MTVRRRILPPVYLLLAFGAMWLLDAHAPLATVLSPPLSYAGVLPIALGMALAAWGAGLFRKLGTPVVPALVVPLFWLVIEFRFVRAEEAFMESLFGGAYLDYKRRVRRWL
jgi:hypothetical protein